MVKGWRTAKSAVAATAVALAFCGGTAAAMSGGLSPHANVPRFHPLTAHPIPEGAFGLVSSVNGVTTAGTCGSSSTAGSFMVRAWKNVADTVDVTTTTTFVDPATTTPSFANVCVGTLVGALGAVSNDVVTATKVFVVPTPAPPTRRGTFGTVASVNGVTTPGTCGATSMTGSFTVRAWKNIAGTVDVATSTAFVDPVATSPSFANVCVGALVGAIGTVSNDVVTAAKVFVVPRTPPSHGVFGMVTSVNGTTTAGTCGVAATAGTFAVTWKTTTDAVGVTSDTSFVDPAASPASFADVCVGVVAGAAGPGSNTLVTAAKVFVVPGRAPAAPSGGVAPPAPVTRTSTSLSLPTVTHPTSPPVDPPFFGWGAGQRTATSQQWGTHSGSSPSFHGFSGSAWGSDSHDDGGHEPGSSGWTGGPTGDGR
jgi:hypothetical protein